MDPQDTALLQNIDWSLEAPDDKELLRVVKIRIQELTEKLNEVTEKYLCFRNQVQRNHDNILRDGNQFYNSALALGDAVRTTSTDNQRHPEDEEEENEENV